MLPSEYAICGMEVPCDKPLEFGPFGAVAVWEDKSSPTAKVEGRCLHLWYMKCKETRLHVQLVAEA